LAGSLDGDLHHWRGLDAWHRLGDRVRLYCHCVIQLLHVYVREEGVVDTDLVVNMGLNIAIALPLHLLISPFDLC
jgi:hypothetical protein